MPAGSFQEAQAEVLPYPDAAFDLVFMGLVLHELDEPLKVCAKLAASRGNGSVVLEWAYREGGFGPPLAHRVARYARPNRGRTGSSQVETFTLTYLVLYRLTRWSGQFLFYLRAADMGTASLVGQDLRVAGLFVTAIFVLSPVETATSG